MNFEVNIPQSFLHKKTIFLVHFFRNILHWLKELLIGEEQSNFRAMVLSVLFASLFWLFNAFNSEHTYFLAMPIKLQYANGMNADTFKREVKITIAGTGWKIAKEYFTNQEKQAVIYRMPATQTHNYVLSGHLRNALLQKLDKDLKIVEIQNDTFFINNNRNVRKSVRLFVDKNKLDLAEGFKVIGQIQINPSVVMFEGSVEKINQMPDSIPITIREANIRKNFDKLVSLSYLESPNLKVLQSGTKVSFQVEQYFSKKLKFEIEKMNFPDNWELTASKAEIICIYKAAAEQEIDLKDFKIIADFSKLHPEDSTVTLQLEHIPQGIEDAKVVNPHCKVKFIKK
jgi:YbbR domain-containing protein